MPSSSRSGSGGVNGRIGTNGSSRAPASSDLARLQQFAQKPSLDDRQRRAERIVTCIVILVILIAVVVVLGAIFLIDEGRNGGGSNVTPTSSPTTTSSPTAMPYIPSTEELKWIILIQSKSPETSFDGDGTSPQRRALSWILNDPVAGALSNKNWTDADKARILQRFALATIWFATTTGGRGTTIPKVWLGPTNECTWNEPNDRITANDVECDDEQQPDVVTKLALAFDNLQGTIPAEIGLLTSLTYLFLGSNQLRGRIPSHVGLLTPLNELYLGSNELEGALPTEMFQCTSLDVLDVSSNPNLKGPIPPEIRQLKQLRELFLYGSPLLTIGSTLPSSLCQTLHRADTDCDLGECSCCTSPWPELRPCKG